VNANENEYNETSQATYNGETENVNTIENEYSETDHQVAIEFLSQMTTIFTGVPREEKDWIDGELVPTGQFILGWDAETQQLLTTEEVPEIYFAAICMGAFVDRDGNQILDAPWMYVLRTGDWASLHYAGHFRLFDFDDSGMPVIFVHFNQTFDGGYAGFYRIFRYVDGEYRMLEMKAFENGEETPHPWIGSSHLLFRDNNDRIITFIDSDYHGIQKYENLILTDEHAELHLITAMDWEDWDAWQQHHWRDWTHDIPYGWMYHNPTIFGTDIPLTLVEPLHELQESITTAIVTTKKGATE